MTVHRLRSRVNESKQQGTAEKIWDVPQLRDGRTRVQIGVIGAPETAIQDLRLQRTVERSLVDKRISARMCEKIGVVEVCH